MLHNGTSAPKTNDYSALILESTYSERDHPNRKQTEQEFYNKIKEVYEDNGHILVPAFAVDRAQEIINVIRKFDKHIPIYLDGMCNDATDIMFKHKNFLRDPKQFRKFMDSIERVYGFRQRKSVLNEPCVVVTTAGMLTGGPAMYYIPNLNKNSVILFTGYCVEGTNGWTLQNKGTMMIDKKEVKIETPYQYFDFSAHAGKKELIQFAKDLNPEKIFCVHGEKCNEFADELTKEHGFKAVAPKLNEEFKV
jgi:putative mRNA 3-end processing factor